VRAHPSLSIEAFSARTDVRNQPPQPTTATNHRNQPPQPCPGVYLHRKVPPAPNVAALTWRSCRQRWGCRCQAGRQFWVAWHGAAGWTVYNVWVQGGCAAVRIWAQGGCAAESLQSDTSPCRLWAQGGCSFLQAARSHAFLERSVGCRLGQRPRLPGKVRVCRFGLCQAGGVAPGPPARLALARGSRAPCGSRAPMSGPGKGLQGPLRLQVLASPAGGLANYSSSSPTVPAPPLNKFSKEASIGPTAAGCMVLPTNLRSSVSVHMESRGR